MTEEQNGNITEAEVVEEKKPESAEQGASSSSSARVNPASLVEVKDGRGIMLRSLAELTGFAGMLVREGAAPKGMTVGHVAIAIQAGMERGLGPLGGLQYGVVINGRFAWNGQGAFALIQNSGVCKRGTLAKWSEGEGESLVGIATGWRVGYKGVDRRTFSYKDARRAGLWQKNDMWKHWPERMLEWRAFGLLARDMFPDVLGGFPLAEELHDYAEEPAEREAKVSRLNLPAPAKTADPLEDLLPVRAPATEAEIAASSEEESDDESAPFASHVEADMEIARQEGLFK